MNNPYIIGAGIVGVALLSLAVVGSAVHTGGSESEMSSASGEEVVVYKDPSCGCCEAYASYLRDVGFDVEVTERTDMRQVKERHGISSDLASCHTAEVAGYTVEGHIPHEVIGTLLSEEPSIDGIALAGMPSGSPGMPGAKDGPFEIMTLSGNRFTQY